MTDIALSSAVSSLVSIQQQMAVASNNIANANTVGYTKQTVQVAERVSGGVGTGVTDLGTINNVDQYLLASVLQSNTQSAQATTFNTYYQNLQQALGQITTSDTGGNDLSSQLATLQSSLTQLADAPENTSLNTQVVGNLDSLCSNLRGISVQVQQLRTNADSQIAQVVTDVNTQLNTINSLNKAIQTATVTNQPIASLTDQRTNALQALTADLGVSYFIDGTGAMQIYTTSGQPLLVGDTVTPLSHTASTIGATSSYQSDQQGGISGIILGSTDITGQISSGKLAALIQQRDTELPNAQNSLNSLAQSLSSTLNNIYGLSAGSPPPSSITGTAGTFNGTDPIYAAAGTTLRVASLDSAGNVSGYVDVNISGAATVNDVVNDINNAASNANPPLAVSASLTGGPPGDLQLTSTGAAGTGVNLATLSGGVSGNPIAPTNPGVDLASYFSLAMPAAKDLLVGGNSAASIAVAPSILANPNANFSAGNGTMASMLTNALQDQQNFSAATAMGTATQSGATTTFSNSASSFIIGGGSTPVTVTLPAGTTTTLQSVAAAVNAASTAAGSTVYASVVGPANGPNQLQITSGGSQVTFSGVTGNLLSTLGLSNAPTGYLATVSTTFSGYATDVTAEVATRATNANNEQTSKQTTLTALQQSLSSQSGVNVDAESAQLVTLQNAYAASAKIVSTVNAMFQSLLQAVGA